MPSLNETDLTWMKQAYDLACRGQLGVYPNPAVGCVLVKQEQLLGGGWHQRCGHNHAEINALNQAREQGFETSGATAYATLEPCNHTGKTPPCCEALIKAGIKRVIVANLDPDKRVCGTALARLEAHQIETSILPSDNPLAQQCYDLNRGYFHYKQQGRCWVRIKWAQSFDGFSALANGCSQWISDPTSRQDVQFWRARSQAIVSTAESVLKDQSCLNVRLTDIQKQRFGWQPNQHNQSLRVILDSRLRLTPKAQLFSVEGPILVVTSNQHSRNQLLSYQRQFATTHQAVEVLTIAKQETITDFCALDFEKVLDYLAKKGCYEVLIEAGSRFNSQCIKHNWGDELLVYLANRLLGDGQIAVKAEAINSLDSSAQLCFLEAKQLADDIRIRALLKPRQGTDNSKGGMA